MIVEKLIMPYILATLHPLMHATCFVTTLVMRSKFLSNWRVEDSDLKEELRERVIRAHHLSLYIHAICFLLHILKNLIEIYPYSRLQSKEYENCRGPDKRKLIYKNAYFCEWLILIKVLLYIVSIIYIQTVVIDVYLSDIKDDSNHNNHVICWLHYEVVIFFFNAFAQSFFLMFSRFQSFITLRERIGYCTKTLRYKKDFLEFCSEDLHWF